jgi:hypothetical protein
MATTGTGQGTGKGTPGRGTATRQTSAGERDRRAADEGNGGIAETLRESTYRSIDEQKSRASDTLGSLAGAVRGMSQPLRDGGQPQIAGYVNKAADGIERWAANLRQQDLEDAMRAVEQFARRQPAMFLGLAFGAGLVAARFLKSSSHDHYGDTRRYGNFGTSAGGPTGVGATGLGTQGVGATGFTGGATGSTRGDIPRVSSDVRPTGEVL